MHNTLESSKFFPIIAWILIIGFALFVYFLATSLKTDLKELSSDVDSLEQKVNDLGVQQKAEKTRQ